DRPAGVQSRADLLHAGQAGARLDGHWDPAAVVTDLDRGVSVQDDLDPAAVATKSLVNRVVDDLPEAVHQPSAVGAADVHAGTLAHRLEALKDLKVVRGVVLGGLARRRLLGGCGLLDGRHGWLAPGELVGTPSRLTAPSDSTDPATPDVTK